MNKKVLIIDDEQLIRTSLSRIFSKRNYTVREASNGREGVAAWRDFSPDIVCLDYMMPELNGIEVLVEVPNALKKTVIVMSAYVGESEKIIFKKNGAKLFIEKPFDDIFKVIDSIEKITQENDG